MEIDESRLATQASKVKTFGKLAGASIEADSLRIVAAAAPPTPWHDFLPLSGGFRYRENSFVDERGLNCELYNTLMAMYIS